MEKRHVYIIRITNTNYYKIGISNDVETRINDLQTATPFDMQLIYNKDFTNFFLIENYIQNIFINKHVRGEWFELTIYDVNSIKRFVQNLEHSSDIESDINKRLISTKKYQKATNKNTKIKSAVFFKNISLGPTDLDLKKDWYVSFYAKENKIDNYKRFKVKGGINRIKDKTERLIASEDLKIHIIRALESGYNPFKDKINLTSYAP